MGARCENNSEKSLSESLSSLSTPMARQGMRWRMARFDKASDKASDKGRSSRGPPAYFTQDWNAARDSVKRLASLNPEVVATGHGIPMRGERMRQELHQLAANFDSVARPTYGRYVNEPAIAGPAGVFSVPPMTWFQKGMYIGGAFVLASMIAGLATRDRD